MRVGMILYALAHEKNLSDRPLRCRVDLVKIVPTRPKRRGKTTHSFSARRFRRYLLRACVTLGDLPQPPVGSLSSAWLYCATNGTDWYSGSLLAMKAEMEYGRTS